jgi:NAD(P)-dependent dehydrogenase (short-subunit alcohol dehydrogenase family)
MDNNDGNKAKVAIVTGSSSGIGFETSLLLARNGFFTYATMRNPDKSNKIIGLKQKQRLPLEYLESLNSQKRFSSDTLDPFR